MPRKRKSLKGLDKNSAEYWNAKLAREGLTTDAGLNRRTFYVGSLREVAFVEEKQFKRDAGIRPAKPQSQ